MSEREIRRILDEVLAGLRGEVAALRTAVDALSVVVKAQAQKCEPGMPALPFPDFPPTWPRKPVVAPSAVLYGIGGPDSVTGWGTSGDRTDGDGGAK